MEKSARKYKAALTRLLTYVLVLIILLLTSINIRSYLAPKAVLGVETEKVDTGKFWSNFIEINPNYIPGLIELGRIDKAKEIDPNYVSGKSE